MERGKTDIAATAVTVRPAARGERAALEGLMQFYIYDFSEMEPPGSTRFPLDEHGRFAPYPKIGEYWRRTSFKPLLIRVGEQLAGFALLNSLSPRGGAVERNMGEFFVVRAHRRGGVATRALHQILAAYPGQWEVAVAERNTGAQAFWPRAIAAAPGVTALERHEGDGVRWRGPIWSFHAARV